MDSRLERLAGSANTDVSKRRQRFAAQVISSTPDIEQTPVLENKTKPIQNLNLEGFNKNNSTSQPISAEEPETSSTDSPSSDSEEEERLKTLMSRPIRPLLKPVFIPKELRGTADKAIVAVDSMTFATETDHREESRGLVADILRKEFEAAHLAKNTTTIDPTLGMFDPNWVDDTDDPAHFEEEYLSWRLRELLRIKEERDEREAYVREKEEIERIRNLTEEERKQIDQQKMEEWASQTNSEYKFLQKYYHKGAFYQEEHKEILSRDYAQATGADRNDRDVLPEMLQVKDFGKKGKGKWKHLTAEDTTAFDYGWGSKDNSINYKSVSKMGGMKGDLDNPAKKQKK